MALATEDDPVQTIKDILDATTNSDYTNSKPSVIEKYAEHDLNWKQNYAGDALYVQRPAEGDMAQSSTESYDETQIVQIEAWSPTGQNAAWTLITDIRDHIWDTYGFDNGAATSWHRVQPVTGIDYRDGVAQGRNQRWVTALQVRLTQLREVP